MSILDDLDLYKYPTADFNKLVGKPIKCLTHQVDLNQQPIRIPNPKGDPMSMQDFVVVKTKGKLFLVTLNEEGVADTLHELKQKNNIQANRVDTAIVNDPKSLIQVARGKISSNLVD